MTLSEQWVERDGIGILGMIGTQWHIIIWSYKHSSKHQDSQLAILTMMDRSVISLFVELMHGWVYFLTCFTCFLTLGPLGLTIAVAVAQGFPGCLGESWWLESWIVPLRVLWLTGRRLSVSLSRLWHDPTRWRLCFDWIAVCNFHCHGSRSWR